MSKVEKNYILKGQECEKPSWENSFGTLIYQSLKKNSDVYGNDTVFINVENKEKNTFRELFNKSIQMACLLENVERNLKENIEHVAIYCENHVEFFIPVIGCLYKGYPIALISHTYSEYELLYSLKTTKPNILFCSRVTENKVNAVCAQNKLDFIKKIFVLENINYNPHPYDTNNFKPTDLAADTVAVIMFSSGTTGMPKGVMITHSNISYFHRVFNDPSQVLSLFKNYIMVMPFSHVYGCITSLISLALGNCVKFMVKFNEDMFLQAIQEHKVTTLALVPPLMVWLSKTPKINNYDVSTVETIFCGAAPLSKDTQLAVKKRLENVNIYQAYGMTELTLSVAAKSINAAINGSVGKLFPGLMMKIRDTNDYKSLGVNEVGEILVRGPCVAKGYYGNPKEGNLTFLPDGWVASGDLGYYDEKGEIYIVDRVKELIKYNAFQVPPAELEGLLLTHEDITDAAVVGLKDETNGELPFAFVVKKHGSNLSEENVQDFIKELVSYPKYLRGGVRFVASIPKTHSGKLLRRQMRDLLNDNLVNHNKI